MLIQHLSFFFFRLLATAADYSLDKELKLAEMDEQSVEVYISNTNSRQLVVKGFTECCLLMDIGQLHWQQSLSWAVLWRI